MFDSNESLAQARARNVREALYEDIGRTDWTSQLIPPQRRLKATVRVREQAVLCGCDWFNSCLHELDATATVHWHYKEGELMDTDTPGLRHHGQRARAALSRTRGAKFFATIVRHGNPHATARRGGKRCRDQCPRVHRTRHPKDHPGSAPSTKYAVRMGGGQNQRLALWDGILIKENHIAAAGGIAQVMAHARVLNAGVDIQIEVESLSQLRAALAAGASNILLDNFQLADMREAVTITAGAALLEVSGGVTLTQLRDIAATGVDRISIGKLTKDVTAIDYSMRVIEIIL